MKAKDKIFDIVKHLNFDDKQMLIKHLTNELFLTDLDKFRTDHTGNKPCCSKCSSKHVVKNGSQGKLTESRTQKFKCKDCKTSFGLLTGTAVHYLHAKEDWMQFIGLTLESKSIRDIALIIGHDKSTMFNWRHKLLSSLENVFEKEFKGIVEMDDMLIRFNQKGRKENFDENVRRSKTLADGKVKRRKISKRGISNEQVSVLFTLDRYKTISLNLLKVGKITKSSLEEVFDDRLVERLNMENVIVTDGCRSYDPVLSAYNHEKLIIRKGEKVRGHFHLNTLNNQCGQYKSWIFNNFKSVSTKYAQNYLNYFKMVFFVLRKSENSTKDLLKFSLKDDNTFRHFHSSEERYLKFIAA